MSLPSVSSDRVLSIYLTLAQYPILATQIRARMRRELFNRGVISPQVFEAEVRDNAIRSQAREALHNPFEEEPANVWELRLMRVRDHLTDFYFAYNLTYELFEEIVREALAERGASVQDLYVSFNPELAPQDMLFEQALAIEKMPLKERTRAEARLREIKVVLIRTLISDQLAYVNIAKEWFTISDLAEIRRRKIGEGKIGGKAAGMLLAARILTEEGDEDVKAALRIPESYFLGADLTYLFMTMNGLMHWGDQKYKSEEQIREDYPQLKQEMLAGKFPADTLERLREILELIGDRPVIVRSSSLLEDNFGTSFAGKYESHFCPNQGTSQENLDALTHAIQSIYASVFNPDALMYRRSKGLQDYDERMAILIQVVQGERFGRYFFPLAAGVAFSRNLYRWSPQIRKEDGFVRMVWGLGTRAVEPVDNDYPRLVALSHPLLRPDSTSKAIRRYSQQYIDVIDLAENSFRTLPITDVINARYTYLRYVAEIEEDGYVVPIRTTMMSADKERIIVTFDELLRRTPLADLLRRMLQKLEKHYHSPVDTEFTAQIEDPYSLNPILTISLLQCRPQSYAKETSARLPQTLYPEDIIFSTRRMVPEGSVEGICYVVFVSPEGYYSLPTASDRASLRRVIGRLNIQLAGNTFICVGPGRWGTTNTDLGVHVGYADIYNTRALVELAGAGVGAAPEPSFGTHFFQDLVEANIYPLAIYLEDNDVVFNRAFFYNTPNRLPEVLPSEAHLAKALRLIDVSSYRSGWHLNLVMDNEQGRAVAFLAPD